MIKENLITYFQNSIKDHWPLPAFSDFNGNTLNYCDVAFNIAKIHLIFKKSGIKTNDKIALLGKNSSNWAIVYLATLTYGAVIVPILADFKPQDFYHIIKHSDSKILFIEDQIFKGMDENELKKLKAVFSLTDFSLKKLKNKKIENGINEPGKKSAENLKNELKPESVEYNSISNKELAVISYTSGTTGYSKGVMLSHNNISANIRFAQQNMPLKPKDRIVSFLPLAHAYGCAFEFLFPFTLGCHITFLTKTPSPQIITQAFSEVKPRLILSVPLIIEKIYNKQIKPLISKPLIKTALKIPGINKIIYRKINKKLTEVFGGYFHEIVIGGAPLNSEVELFFRKIDFPITVGYGMTECGPLISYSPHNIIKMHSSGKLVDTLDIKILSKDPYHIDGEILVKGENVMTGYYKNDVATESVLDKNGWLHTGDLGVIDEDGQIYIKGRNKSMLLGPSGQNIYPEEIESVLNNKYCVLESLVISEDNRLIALVYPDKEFMQLNNISEDEIQKIMNQNLKEVNHQIPVYMNLSKIIIQTEEFEKTPKRSIKRFLYTK